MNYTEIVEKQRTYYLSGATRSYEFRRGMLKLLRLAIYEHEELLYEAMQKDMNKCRSEVYMTEIGMVLEELSYHEKHLKKWMKNRKVRTPLAQFPSKSFVSPEGYGVALIMSPWNYPIQLCLSPLIGAISAGCTAIVKPSAYTSETSKALKKLLESVFPPEYIIVIEGGREQNAALLEQCFDYIFFTGSPTVGKLVMESAAKNLTPITLELGGKSPVIVDKTADIRLAARRIAFGKVLNAGQTCVEPDYLFIHKSVKAEFIDAFAAALREFFPDGNMSDMNVIVNSRHFERVAGLLNSGKPVVGGGTDRERRFIEPTLLDNVAPDSPIMNEEIFGPILPMLEYTDPEECIRYITGHPKPLAFYLFTRDKKLEKKFLDSCSFGGGCINDTIVHLATPYMPFGGVGASGMGSYHGKKSFDTFTHYRSILKKSNLIDLKMRYRPYNKRNDKIIKFFMK